jgi:hypothetical protein
MDHCKASDLRQGHEGEAFPRHDFRRAPAAAALGALLLAACGGDGGDASQATTAGSHWEISRAATPPWSHVTWSDAGFLAVGTRGALAASADGITWTRHDTAGGEGWRAAVRGVGQWLVLGSRGELLASPDANAWTVPAPPLLGNASAAQPRRAAAGADVRPEVDIDLSMGALAYGNGVFVAGGEGVPTFTSPDGVHWTGPSPSFGSIAFGNGLFVSQEFGVATSPDGVTWTTLAGGPQSASGIDFVDGVFVTLGWAADTNAYASVDGVNWTATPQAFIGPTRGLKPLGVAGDTLYVTADDGLQATRDGVAWSSVATNADLSRVVRMAGSATRVAAVAYDGRILAGPDLGHLSEAAPASPGDFTAVDVVGDTAVALASNGRVALRSGGTWATVATIAGAEDAFTPSALAHAPDGTLVASGDGYTAELIGFARSTDGRTWTVGASAGAGLGTGTLAAVVHDGNRFVAVDNQMNAFASATGEQWSALATLESPHYLLVRALAFGGGRYVAVGTDGYAATSTDGVHWSVAAPVTTAGGASPLHFTGVAWNGQRFVACAGLGLGNVDNAGAGLTATSTDGRAWTVAPSATSEALRGVAALPGGPFVAVGAHGVAQTSMDGVHWTRTTASIPQELGAAAAANGEFIVVGEDGLVETSSR